MKISILERIKKEALEKKRAEQDKMREELIEEYRMNAHVMVANEIAKAKFQMEAEFEQVIQARILEINSKRD